MQRVRLAGQREQLGLGRLAVQRLRHDAAFDREGLIGAKHQTIGMPRTDLYGFLAGQQRGNRVRVMPRRESGRLDKPLVQVGRDRLEGNAGRGKKGAARLALGRED